jgi:hypothetical protein
MEGNCSTKWTRRLPFFALLGASAISNLGGVLTVVAISWFVLETGALLFYRYLQHFRE